MSEPYTVSMVRSVLKGMSPDRLQAVLPTDFHKWPTRKIVPAAIIRELIINERARRR